MPKHGAKAKQTLLEVMALLRQIPSNKRRREGTIGYLYGSDGYPVTLKAAGRWASDKWTDDTWDVEGVPAEWRRSERYFIGDQALLEWWLADTNIVPVKQDGWEIKNLREYIHSWTHCSRVSCDNATEWGDHLCDACRDKDAEYWRHASLVREAKTLVQEVQVPLDVREKALYQRMDALYSNLLDAGEIDLAYQCVLAMEHLLDQQAKLLVTRNRVIISAAD